MASDNDLLIREAAEADVPVLAAIYSADDMGGHADTADPSALADYLRAFHVIKSSNNEWLYVAERAGVIVGTFQLLLATKMTGRGSAALIVESVQTRPDCRGQGIGAVMMRFAIEQAKALNAGQMQLTSNNMRLDAHRFYERLGFEKSHQGFRMRLK